MQYNYELSGQLEDLKLLHQALTFAFSNQLFKLYQAIVFIHLLVLQSGSCFCNSFDS